MASKFTTSEEVRVERALRGLKLCCGCSDTSGHYASCLTIGKAKLLKPEPDYAVPNRHGVVVGVSVLPYEYDSTIAGFGCIKVYRDPESTDDEETN